MAEVTRVFRSKGLGYEGLEYALKEFEWDAAAFFAAPVELSRTRRINGGQHIEFTYTKADEMALFGKPKAEEAPMADRTGARNLSGLLKEQFARLKQDIDSAQSEIVGAFDSMGTSVKVAKQVAGDVKAEAAELQAAVGQLSNSPPE